MMPVRIWPRLAVWLLLVTGAGFAEETPPAPVPVRYLALLNDTRIGEISGFAASRRHPGVLWTHNDSGDGPRLYALGLDGAIRAVVELEGVRNIDWEDIALQGHEAGDLLLVADTGDNGGLRRELAIHALREPVTIADATLPVSWTMRFRWPDGPRDCEAMAVDPESGEILLISKKRVPPELFRLPARPDGERIEVAEPLGVLAGVEQPSAEDLQRNPVYGRYRAQITAADIAPDGRTLAVLNYRRLLLYARAPGEDWKTAVARPPRVMEYPWLPQAEAVTFAPDGSRVWIGSEKLPVPLIELDLSPPDAQAPVDITSD